MVCRVYVSTFMSPLRFHFIKISYITASARYFLFILVASTEARVSRMCICVSYVPTVS